MTQLKHIPAFLSTVRSALLSGSGSGSGSAANLHWVVLGNESGDLDSAISSLLYAFSLTHKNQQLAAPILPIPRADIVLRTEITYFLTSLGIDPLRDLFFADDLDRIYSSTCETKPKLALVDFNALPPSLAHLRSHVAAIIDHHIDSGDFTSASPRVIEPVGSATSLVVRDCFTADAGADIKAEVARLALGPILLDTINLNHAMQRTTDVDETAAASCLSWLPPHDAVDTSALYAAMLKAKADTTHLSTADLLRKDYKEFELREGVTYGMASVMWDLHKWIARDGAQGVLQAATESVTRRGLHSLYILTAFEDNQGGFHRQLAVVGGAGCARERVVEALKVREEAKGLQVREAEGQDRHEQLIVYDVGKHVSRKVLQPLLHRVLVDL